MGQQQLGSWGEVLRALSSRTGSSAHPACVRSTKGTTAPQRPIGWARRMCFSVTVSPPRPPRTSGLPQQIHGTIPMSPHTRVTGPHAPYLRRRWSGLLQGPPEKRRWLKGVEGGRLFTASSHGRIGDVRKRMGKRDLRLQAGRDTSTLDPARRTLGHPNPRAAGAPDSPQAWALQPSPHCLLWEREGRRGQGSWMVPWICWSCSWPGSCLCHLHSGSQEPFPCPALPPAQVTLGHSSVTVPAWLSLMFPPVGTAMPMKASSAWAPRPAPTLSPGAGCSFQGG